MKKMNNDNMLNAKLKTLDEYIYNYNIMRINKISKII